MLADVVEGRRRLVEEEHLRLPDYGAGNEDALALTAGNPTAIGCDGCVHAHRHLADVAVECRQARCLPGIIIGQQRVVEEDVFTDGTLDELAVLHTDADAVAAQATQVDVGDVVLVVEHRARLGFLQSHHQTHQRALATARRSDQGHIVAAVDGQVETVEEQWHVVGIAELQGPDIHATGDALDHMTVCLDLRLGGEDGTTELHLRQQAGYDLDDGLQLKDCAADNSQYGTVGDVVGERQLVVPGRCHRHYHRQELKAVADAVHVEAGQGLAAAVHLRRSVSLGPLVEGTELRPGGLQFLDSREQREERTDEMRAGRIDVQLHLTCIIEDQQDGDNLYGDDDDAGVEQRTAIEEELDEHDAGEQEGQDGGQEACRQVGADARQRQQAVGEVAGCKLLGERGRQQQQARHQGYLQRILHLIFNTHHHEVTGYLYHHQSGGSTEKQRGDGDDQSDVA